MEEDELEQVKLRLDDQARDIKTLMEVNSEFLGVVKLLNDEVKGLKIQLCDNSGLKH